VNVTAEGLKPSDFMLAGITNLQADNSSMHFFFKGDINTILKMLNGFKVVDVTIEEPTLEEIFMHYYE
jgi:ABC-2 type transport system ATP-binding protein